MYHILEDRDIHDGSVSYTLFYVPFRLLIENCCVYCKQDILVPTLLQSVQIFCGTRDVTKKRSLATPKDRFILTDLHGITSPEDRNIHQHCCDRSELGLTECLKDGS
jgi:hypothetical protein